MKRAGSVKKLFKGMCEDSKKKRPWQEIRMKQGGFNL